MAKDAHKKCVFTALLIFWANCVSSSCLVLTAAGAQADKCVQGLIYLKLLSTLLFFQLFSDVTVDDLKWIQLFKQILLF